jgi:dTDP-4-dehydrorhamnose 3,5-epimerase
LSHLEVEKLSLTGVLRVTVPRYEDTRGYFSESYSHAAFAEAGIACTFVQDNQSFSSKRGTIRGLHFQLPPFAQAKLVRVLRGSIYDTAVDLRRASPTFGKHISAVFSAGDGGQFFVPTGFAHGFCTLEPDTEVLYKVSAPYSREHERALQWNDPALEIAWPVSADEAILSERDRNALPLHALTDYF